MNKEIQISNFKTFLCKKGYSSLVIEQYGQRVKEFLKCNEVVFVLRTDQKRLKEIISKYLQKTPLTSQKSTIQASLHAYYYFLTGKKIFKRLSISEFKINTAIESEIERFQRYLIDVAGLSNNTVTSQCSTVKIFLYSSFPEKNFLPEKIVIEHVKIYLTSTISHLSNASKKTIITRIRSYIKFLQFSDGLKLEEILQLPMTSPVWKRSSIPKYLTESEIDNLFSSYNRTRPAGIRDYAIARCLKDLGLRCSEVARLSLDDFNWLEGTVTIRETKTYSERILPLHIVTGRAIEEYLLHSRPKTQERRLFIRFKNELGKPMGTSQVRYTVRSAAVRAGLDKFTGTHMLRHTAAKEMINNGIDLKMIADILGHESVETTSIYTKINFTELQDVAGVWPEVEYD